MIGFRLALTLIVQSKVLIIESVAVSAVAPNIEADTNAPLAALNGETYEQIVPPPYIPANLGWASKTQAGLNLHLLSLFNAQARTRVRAWSSGIHAQC